MECEGHAFLPLQQIRPMDRNRSVGKCLQKLTDGCETKLAAESWWSLGNNDNAFRRGFWLWERPTIELTGVQKQSEAALLHVRVKRIVRSL